MINRRGDLRVVLADDHEMFRQALCALLEQKQIHVIGEAADGREAFLLASQLLPDVAIFDLSMPIMSGIEAARELNRTTPGIGSILLTMHDEDAYILDALRAGVRGYVLKAQAANDLLDAIRQVERGTSYISPGISDKVVRAFMTRTTLNDIPLSGRERQVLQLIAEGNTSKDVARLLNLSVKTAEAHRTRMMKKLDIHDTAGLVRYAIRHGLVSA